MIYLTPPNKPIIINDKKEQVIKNQYISSTKDELIFYTGVMTYECAVITLKSYRNCFPEFEHKMISINLKEEL